MPTLLAWLGKDGETDCMGHLSDGDWTRPGSHGWSGPYEYFPADISADLCASCFRVLLWPLYRLQSRRLLLFSAV